MIKNKRSNKKGTKLLCFSDYDIFYYYDSCFKCTEKLMNSLEPDTLRDHQARTVYLVTYSQVDLEKVGNRKALADIVTVALNQNKLSNCVEYCAKERHREGVATTN